jgi:hypothetical protein
MTFSEEKMRLANNMQKGAASVNIPRRSSTRSEFQRNQKADRMRSGVSALLLSV